MNKKLKKALYMFGFVLPIVAIPIITVACGTQTSQITPKEAAKKVAEAAIERAKVEEVVENAKLPKVAIKKAADAAKKAVEWVKNVAEATEAISPKAVTKALEEALKEALEAKANAVAPRANN